MIGFHHLRARIRTGKGLEHFPSRSRAKRLLDYFMYAIGVGAPFALLPQILQLYSTKSSVGLSLPTWSLLTVFNLLWATYALVHKDKHILFANAVMAVFNASIIVGILLYS